MENQIVELKAMVAKLAAEVATMKVERAEDKVFLKALNETASNLSAQVQNLDKQVEVTTRQPEGEAKPQTKAEAKAEAKKVPLSEIGELFKQDPAKAAEVMRRQGLDPGAGLGGRNPWVYNDRKGQELLEKVDPKKAARLRAEAAMFQKVHTH